MDDEMITIRTLARIDDPQRGGASIRRNVEITVSKHVAEKLIAEGKAVKANADTR